MVLFNRCYRESLFCLMHISMHSNFDIKLIHSTSNNFTNLTFALLSNLDRKTCSFTDFFFTIIFGKKINKSARTNALLQFYNY